jgi:septum formation protein
MPEASRLILASASATRRAVLESAGLVIDVVPANIDEAAIRDAILDATTGAEGADIASVLAAEKARLVSETHRDALVVGADQVLALGGKIFGKAESIGEAREILTMLRGRTHELISAVALARNGTVYWQTSAFAEMTVRKFSDEFLGCYLEKLGDRVLRSVGCYEIEGPGAQLFEHIDGDYFTILGIPLIELLSRLRHEGIISA